MSESRTKCFQHTTTRRAEPRNHNDSAETSRATDPTLSGIQTQSAVLTACRTFSGLLRRGGTPRSREDGPHPASSTEGGVETDQGSGAGLPRDPDPGRAACRDDGPRPARADGPSPDRDTPRSRAGDSSGRTHARVAPTVPSRTRKAWHGADITLYTIGHPPRSPRPDELGPPRYDAATAPPSFCAIG